MPMALTTRTVSLEGRRWRLAGWPEDSFFRHAGRHMGGMTQLSALARAMLPLNAVVVDVGANLGLSLFALAPHAARALAVEASPRTAQALARTIALNRLAQVQVAAVALAAAPGELAFRASAHSAGSHLLSPETLGEDEGEVLRVPVTTLDALVAEHALPRVDFIKIDVEGHETEVLDGARQTLARHRPAVYLEFNAWVLQANRRQNPRAVLEDWLGRFPFAHAMRAGKAPFRITPATLLAFLHEHLVQRGCADDLVLSFDDGWLARWG